MLCSWRKVQQNLGVAMSQVSGPVQFSSVTQLCLTLCDPMDCSTPGFPGHHQLLEFAEIHVHQVGDATYQSHLLLSPSPPALNLSQHQGIFQWVSSSLVQLSPFSTRSEEKSLVSQGPCCLQSWLGAIPGKCALSTHTQWQIPEYRHWALGQLSSHSWRFVRPFSCTDGCKEALF